MYCLSQKSKSRSGFQPQYRLSEKSFQPSQVLVDLGQFLARVREEVLDLQLGTLLPHIDGERRAIAPAG